MSEKAKANANELIQLTLENARLAGENAALSRYGAEVKAQRAVQLENSLSSLVAGAMGQSNLTSFDPLLQNAIYAPISLNWPLLMYTYKTHGTIQTAIDVPVRDALRDGIELHSRQLSEANIQEIYDDLEEFGRLETVADVGIWGKLFGGSALIANTESDASEELKKIKAGDIIEFYDANRWELTCPWKPSSSKLSNFPIGPAGLASPASRTEELFDFYGKKIHRSRLTTFVAKRAPYIIRWQLSGWGMSDIERMIEPLNTYLRCMNVIYELLNEAKVDVYRLKDLNTNLMDAAAQLQVERRMALTNSLKTYQSAIVMDMEDEYTQKQIQWGGLADMVKEARVQIASALRMPMTKLFGLSAQGFSSGQDDIENYNAMVESEVRQPLRPLIRKMLKLVAASHFGSKELDLNFTFKPLRVLSALDEETIKTQKATRYMSLYQAHLIDSKEMGELQQKDRLVSIEIAASRGELDPHPAADPVDGGFGEGGSQDSAGAPEGTIPQKGAPKEPEAKEPKDAKEPKAKEAKDTPEPKKPKDPEKTKTNLKLKNDNKEVGS